MTDTTSIQVETTQPMSCSVSSSFETQDGATINDASISALNATFSLSSQDISLVSNRTSLKSKLEQLVIDPSSLRTAPNLHRRCGN